MSQEEELIAAKLRGLQAEASLQLSLKRQTEIAWLIRLGFVQSLPNLPRLDHLGALLKIANNSPPLLQALFASEEAVCALIDQGHELYDLAFVVENHLRVRGTTVLEGAPLNRLERRVVELFEGSNNEEGLLYLQGLRMFMSLSQSSTKEPAATFLGTTFGRQRLQAVRVYQYVFRPLFEKKNLKPLYSKLAALVHWLVLIPAEQTDTINDLSKKLNSFVLYHRDDASIEMISACSALFDLLSVRFPRQAQLQHASLAALLVKLRSTSLKAFFQIWLANRSSFLDTLDFQFLLRALTQMGAGSLVLEVLAEIWSRMRKTGKYNVLLKIFSGYLRKEYLKLWMERPEELARYVKIAKYFMVGLSNRERFEGEEIDQMTLNLCRHAISRGISLTPVAREVIEMYSLYENRFSYLSQTSKRFLTEIRERFNLTIDTANIHALFQELTIRELSPQEEEFWQRGKVSYRYRGLVNLGNTCYLNAFMQALYMTRKFRALVYQLTQDGSLPSNRLKTYALQNLFEELSKKQLDLQAPFRPEYFRMQLSEPFNTSPMQQDAAQFGRVYLQQLDKQLQGAQGGLQRLLAQRLQKSIRCLRCGKEKKQEEKMFDLILAIERTDNELYLSKLLQQYFTPEKFTEDNKVYCSGCGSKENAASELVPLKLSQVVVLTLSLFDYVNEGRKILTPLIFEFTLNFDLLLGQRELGEYQLYAFIVHLGSNPTSGHYVCYARNLEENPMVWYCMDDGYVTEREISKAEEFDFGPNETPYLLFYSRKAAPRGKH